MPSLVMGKQQANPNRGKFYKTLASLYTVKVVRNRNEWEAVTDQKALMTKCNAGSGNRKKPFWEKLVGSERTLQHGSK